MIRRLVLAVLATALPLLAVVVAAALPSAAPAPAGGEHRTTPAYWLVASDGGIFTFGGATVLRVDRRHGPQQAGRGHGRARPAAPGTGWSPPTAGSSPTATRSSTAAPGAWRSTSRSSGMAATPDGKGYWLVASDGGIFSYGDAQF